MDERLFADTDHRDEIRVLLVDDDADLADVTAASLEREFDAMTVETEADPTVVVDRLSECEYDCVVSDYEMPERDGLAVLESVRSEYPDLPFVLFTGHGSEALAADAIAAGVTDYLRKGAGTDQYTVLGNRIENAVEGYRAERAQQRLRERYRSLVVNAPYAVSIYRDDSVVHANESWAELLGAERPEEVVGQSKDDFVANEDLPVVEERMEHVIGDRTTVDWREKRIVGVDGATRTVESCGAPIAGVDGDKTAIQVVARDVSERVRRERELRAAKERFRKVFEHSNDAIMVVDMAEEAFLEVNSAACEMLGYDRAELLELNPADIHPDDIDRVRDEFVSQVRSEGTGFTDDLTCLTKGGEEIPTEVSGAILDLDDESDGPKTMVAILRDVSEREAFRADLEREVERLEEFTSVVSHDLRNPLNVARGRLELAQSEVDSDHLDAVERAHERMETLIDDLLALAREGQAATDVEPVRLDEVVEACWRNVETGDATLVNETGHTIPADRGRLVQLLENLIRNSIEHGSSGMTVRVGDSDSGFFVADDGPGIPESERESVFDIDYTTSEDGTGFGLRIVTRIADSHGWEVRVRDSESGGARFDVIGVDIEDATGDGELQS